MLWIVATDVHHKLVLQEISSQQHAVFHMLAVAEGDKHFSSDVLTRQHQPNRVAMPGRVDVAELTVVGDRRFDPL